jgi:ABC-type lipoprotein export system ATPase subunit
LPIIANSAGGTNAEGDESPTPSSSGLIVALEDVSVDFHMGELTCVIGAVGSGKSALIQMLAGELPPSTGILRRRRRRGGRDVSIAYAPQDPWIMDGTVRENVLLGCEYDSIKYVSVIRSCGLDVDLDLRSLTITMRIHHIHYSTQSSMLYPEHLMISLSQSPV